MKANMNCTDVDQFRVLDGTCCDRCAAGWHMKAECDRTKKTECSECRRGFYTATKNHMDRCLPCKVCSSSNQMTEKDCTAKQDTICKCMTGYYCSNQDCVYCALAANCPVGEGVKVQAIGTNNTICAPCEDGTYSNVTDSYSPCQTHTRCEDIGRVLKTQGTSTTDAICGPFLSHCPWILPAGLWSGLVLTALILFGLICWRAKRKSYKPVRRETTHFLQPPFKSRGIPGAPVPHLELSIPFTEINGHCQETCAVEGCKLPPFNTDDNIISYGTQDSTDSSFPITPLKPSVSFAESNHINGSAGYCSANLLRSHSEPQEDEWCGT